MVYVVMCGLGTHLTPDAKLLLFDALWLQSGEVIPWSIARSWKWGGAVQMTGR